MGTPGGYSVKHGVLNPDVRAGTAWHELHSSTSVKVNKNTNLGYSQEPGLVLVSGSGFPLGRSCFAYF